MNKKVSPFLVLPGLMNHMVQLRMNQSVLASPNSLEAYFELSIGLYLHVDSYLIKEDHSELFLWCAVLHKSLSLMTPFVL